MKRSVSPALKSLENYCQAGLGRLGASCSRLVPSKLTEIYCEARIDLLRNKWSWMIAAFVYSWHRPWQERFYQSTFALLAKMAAADAKICAEELAAVEDFTDSCLRLNPRQKAAALRAFRTARESNVSFQEAAKRFYAMHRNSRAMLENMFVVLLEVAYADTRRCAAEDRMIEVARWVFCIPHPRYLELKNRYFTSELLRQRLQDIWQRQDKKQAGEDRTQARREHRGPETPANGAGACYALLGATPADPLAVIKRRYRTLALKYHPDRVRAQVLGEERVAEFQARFREVQEAYEQILKSHPA